MGNRNPQIQEAQWPSTEKYTEAAMTSLLKMIEKEKNLESSQKGKKYLTTSRGIVVSILLSSCQKTTEYRRLRATALLTALLHVIKLSLSDNRAWMLKEAIFGNAGFVVMVKVVSCCYGNQSPKVLTTDKLTGSGSKQFCSFHSSVL